jgi:hypothetical protein
MARQRRAASVRQDQAFKGRQCTAEVILWAVRWYLMFPELASFTADGAYDQASTYDNVAQRHPDAAVVVPPHSTAVPSETAESAPTQRDRHLQSSADQATIGALVSRRVLPDGSK